MSGKKLGPGKGLPSHLGTSSLYFHEENPVRPAMKITADFQLTTQQLAELFCQLADEEQAQFFIECGRIAATWSQSPYGADTQWREVGKHLQVCACSTDEARGMIEELHYGLHKPQPNTNPNQ
jgi:hypothetical protein